MAKYASDGRWTAAAVIAYISLRWPRPKWRAWRLEYMARSMLKPRHLHEFHKRTRNLALSEANASVLADLLNEQENESGKRVETGEDQG